MSKYAKNWKGLNYKEKDSLLGDIILTLYVGFIAFLSIYSLIVNIKVFS